MSNKLGLRSWLNLENNISIDSLKYKLKIKSPKQHHVCFISAQTFSVDNFGLQIKENVKTICNWTLKNFCKLKKYLKCVYPKTIILLHIKALTCWKRGRFEPAIL